MSLFLMLAYIVGLLIWSVLYGATYEGLIGISRIRVFASVNSLVHCLHEMFHGVVFLPSRLMVMP